MNDATLLFSRVAKINADSEDCADFRGVKAQQFVGEHAEPMTDEEREEAAFRAGNAMLAWYSQYRETGNSAYLDNAYHALGLQKKLLAGRSPEFVARLERERGIA